MLAVPVRLDELALEDPGMNLDGHPTVRQWRTGQQRVGITPTGYPLQVDSLRQSAFSGPGLCSHPSSVPVYLGDRDWARAEEKTHDLRLVSGAEMIVVENAGYFLSLDSPDELIAQLHVFCGFDTGSMASGGSIAVSVRQPHLAPTES